MREFQDIIKAFKQIASDGRCSALATVVKTKGSVYRRPGARMLLVEDGQTIGSISGGCLEGDVFERSQPLMFYSGVRRTESHRSCCRSCDGLGLQSNYRYAGGERRLH